MNQVRVSSEPEKGLLLEQSLSSPESVTERDILALTGSTTDELLGEADQLERLADVDAFPLRNRHKPGSVKLRRRRLPQVPQGNA